MKPWLLSMKDALLVTNEFHARYRSALRRREPVVPKAACGAVWVLPSRNTEPLTVGSWERGRSSRRQHPRPASVRLAPSPAPPPLRLRLQSAPCRTFRPRRHSRAGRAMATALGGRSSRAFAQQPQRGPASHRHAEAIPVSSRSTASASSRVASVMAIPLAPARQVRPIRWI
jgi:hypothetical protein